MGYVYNSILFNRGEHTQHRIWRDGRIVEQAVCGTGSKRDLAAQQRFEARVKELNAAAPVSA